MPMSDEIERLDQLRQRGALNEAEFTAAKARLLGQGAGGAGEPFVAAVNALRRSRQERWIAGVCGGLARSTGMAPWAWRLLAAVLALCGGAGIVLYVLCWIFVPQE